MTRNKIGTAAVAGALAIAGLLGTGGTALAAGDPIGPFKQLSECLSAGNHGIDEGWWTDYDCEGEPPAVYLYPVH
ncbi:hypothetical protein JOF56_007899 [Kibdelosporangium banguiense]|uniref:Secreted protein n=1 Tax=Kibdelosporangium banguiense TaxID=1365924 RepID=A0ABS4TSY5_9PSEU|nr:hypothetical protein [Kibdelosporangium banguiense]MBP2327514.1 hypothetical protein [Kibdelosporangium banguiense]